MIEKDKDGWVDPNKYLPLDYDLVLVLVGEKMIPAWHALGHWDGLRLPLKAEVKCWKEKRDDEEKKWIKK